MGNITVDPPNTASFRTSIPPLSGLAKKQRYWKTGVKVVIINNQEKHIRDLKISGGIGGRAVNGAAVLGGTTVLLV